MPGDVRGHRRARDRAARARARHVGARRHAARGRSSRPRSARCVALPALRLGGHLPVARDVRVRAVLRQRDGEIHVGERRQRHHAVEDAATAARPDRLRQREVVPRAVPRDPRDRRAARRLGAGRHDGPVPRRAARQRGRGGRRSASTRPAGASPRSRSRPGSPASAAACSRCASRPRATTRTSSRSSGCCGWSSSCRSASRTVEGAIQAAAGFIFFQRVVLEDWIPWIVNHALGPAVLVITAIIVLALVRGRFGVFAAIAAIVGVSFFVYYFVGAPVGRSTRCRPGSRPSSSASVRSRTPSIPKASSSTTSAVARADAGVARQARRRAATARTSANRRPMSRRRAARRSERRSEPARRAERHEEVRGHHRARRRSSLDVGERELVGLIGPNGAGKTTFFNCLLGILRPTRARHASTART